jgi:oxygen-dependent protoporphyrinogen oxidase
VARRIVVVGGGITGLAAAFFLGQAGADVVVLEQAERLGGKVWTEPFAGLDLDTGADAFLARTNAATDLCVAVGLGEELVAPATGTAWVWTRGRLRRLPAGLLGVPTDLVALARGGVLSPIGTARAALDLVLPGRGVDVETSDHSVAEVVRRRLGREALQRLVDPLVGGINAGRTEDLSLRTTTPQLATAARRRSLIAGARAMRAAGPTNDAPVFLTVRGGLRRLIGALEQHLRAGSVDVRRNEGVDAIERDGATGWVVTTTRQQRITADGVVITTPAPVAARLLGDLSPTAAGELAAVTYASVALVTMAYRRADVPGPLDGSGFLVPRVDGRLMTAASWVNNKWPHLDRPGQFVLRASAGRAGDNRAMSMDDDALIDGLHRELAVAMGINARPTAARVHRWVDAFPQFRVGHQVRMAAMEQALQRDAPGVVVAGAAQRGVGLPTCITGAQEAALTLVGDE